MPRLIIALVRHGAYRQPLNVPSAHLPAALTPEGEEQARRGAEVLRRTADKNGWRIHPVIDCSTLLRGWRTAEIMSREPGNSKSPTYRTEQFDALAERGLGAAANLTIEEIEDVVDGDPRFDPLPLGWKSDSRFRLPLIGAESLIDAGKRVARHVSVRVSALGAEISTDTVKIFVGHGAAFRHAAAELGVLTLAEVGGLSMHHCRPVFLEQIPDGTWIHVAGHWKERNRKPEPPE